MKDDINGRMYLECDKAKAGQVVELDDGFDCHCAGRVTLAQDSGGLFFECTEGKHYIEGQVEENGYCIGIYPVD